MLCIFACTIDDVWTWNTFLLYSYPVSNVVSYGLGFRLECAGYQELLRCRGVKLFTVTSMFKPIIEHDQIMWGPVHWAYKFWDTLESGLWGLEWNNSHQCTSSGWGRSSCFGDEPKTHPLALPRDFSAPFSAPKFSPPTYSPPSYLLPSLLPTSALLPPSPHFLLTPSPKLRRAHELE